MSNRATELKNKNKEINEELNSWLNSKWLYWIALPIIAVFRLCVVASGILTPFFLWTQLLKQCGQ